MGGQLPPPPVVTPLMLVYIYRVNTDKRSFTSFFPFQSLLGRVGATVKDMLSPSWLVDLVNTVKRSPTKGDAISDEIVSLDLFYKNHSENNSLI